MINKIKFYILILITYLFSINLCLSEDKIAFIDLDLVLKKSKIGQSYLVKIKQKNEENIKNLKSKENELKKIEDDIKKKQNILSKEELDKEIFLLKEKIKKFRSDKDKVVLEFNNMKKENLNNFFDQINPIIQSYMDENSIDILIERKNIFMGKKNSDITNTIVKKIDSKL